jgi:hypothetical protein
LEKNIVECQQIEGAKQNSLISLVARQKNTEGEPVFFFKKNFGVHFFFFFIKNLGSFG